MEMSQQSDLTKKTLHGLLWNYLSHYSGKVLLFISTIFLARILSESDYGVAGYAIVTISFLDFLNDLGIGSALIYHKEDPRASSTAFWLGLLVSTTLFTFIWFFAPVMGAFFRDDRAIMIIRVMAVVLPLTALSNIQESLLRKSLSFNRRFIPDITRSVSKGAFSIIFAVLGYGAWSLVLGQLCGTLLSTIVYWVISPWKPSFVFVPSFVRSLLSFGLGMVGINALGALLLQVDYLLVGRYLGAASLGIYMIAFRIPELIILQLCGIVAAKVFFPVYSSLRSDPPAMYRAFLTTTRYLALITVPLGLGIFLVAEPLTLTVLGTKWTEAIPVMRAIAIYTLIHSLGYNLGDIFKAQGKMNILISISILRAVILVPSLWWAAAYPGTTTAIAWTQVTVAAVCAVINPIVATRIFNIKLQDLFGAMLPAFISGAIMTVGVLGTLALVESLAPIFQLICTIGIGGLFYGAALWWLQRDIVLTAQTSLRTAFAKQ